MIESLYRMSHWSMGSVVVGLTAGASLAIYAAFHKLRRRKPNSEEAALGPAFAGIIATVTSLLLAFTAVSVWEAFKAADGAVVSEATSATMLARDLASIHSPEAHEAREVLRDYLHAVVDKEWSQLETGGQSQEARGLLDDLFRAIAKIEPKNKAQEGASYEVWSKLNEIAKYRRERLISSRSRVPPTLWAVVILGTVLTVLCACYVPPSPFGWFMMTALSTSFGLVFFFIVAMERPYSGLESVQPEAMVETLSNMEFWDKNQLAIEAAAKAKAKRR